MSTTTQQHFDAVVLGSGQGGGPLATALAQSGRKTALIERIHIGGCCINEGCTPTKTMIASGRIAYLANRAGSYGVWQKQDGEREKITPVVDMKRVRERKREIVQSFRGGSERRLEGVEGLEVIMGEASFTGSNSLEVSLGDGGGKVDMDAETFFINVGARPAMPALKGLAEVMAKKPEMVLDSTSVMELDRVPEKLVVLGGGYIAMGLGQLFQGLGSQVTIVQRGKQLVDREDGKIADEVRKIVEKEGMVVHTQSLASEVSLKNDNRVVVACMKKGSDEVLELEGSHLLVAVGRTPNTDSLNPQKAGIETDSRGYIKVSFTLQTNISHIYALGDVKGGPAFTHISYDDYRFLKANFIDKHMPALTITDRLIPYVVYIDPQLGHVGLHEWEARNRYPDKKIQTATMPMEYVARALETDETRGMMKAVVDADSGKILGFTCLGMEGGEIMSIVQTAMMGNLPYARLRDACYAHPTLAESLNNLWGFLK